MQLAVSLQGVLDTWSYHDNPEEIIDKIYRQYREMVKDSISRRSAKMLVFMCVWLIPFAIAVGCKSAFDISFLTYAAIQCTPLLLIGPVNWLMAKGKVIYRKTKWMLENLVRDIRQRFTKCPIAAISYLNGIEYALYLSVSAKLRKHCFTEFVTPHNEMMLPFIKRLADGGVFINPVDELIECDKSGSQQCYRYAILNYRELAGRFDLYYGFSYSEDDAAWHQHAFLIDRATGRIYEPTPCLNRQIYFGVKLTDSEIDLLEVAVVKQQRDQ